MGDASIDVANAPLAELVEWLRSASVEWTVDLCRSIRDRSALSLGAAPRDSVELAAALAARSLQSSKTPHAARAYVWRARAEASLFSGQWAQSDAHYRRAVQAARRAGDIAHLGQLLVGWIGALSARGKHDEAAAAAGEAERALQRSKDVVYLAKLYMNVGNAAYHEEKYASALATYEKAIDAFTAAGIRDTSWSGLLINVGVACTNTGKLEEANDYLGRAEAVAGEMNDDVFVAYARYNRAHVWRWRGDYREALADLRRAETSFDRAGAGDMTAATHLTRAEVYLELGMPGDAATEAEQAMAGFAEVGLDLDVELARLVVARATLRRGFADRAVIVLAESAAYFRAHRLWPRLAMSRLLLAEARLRENDPSTARHAAVSARAAFRRRHMQSWEARSETMLAEIDFRRGRLGLAEKAFGRALRLQRHLQPAERATVFDLGGRIAWAQGEIAAAGSRFRKAIAAVDAQQRLIPGAAYRSRAFDEQAVVYRHAIDFACSPSTTGISSDTLWEWVEAARARGHIERRDSRRRLSGELEADRGRLRSLVQRAEALDLESNRTDMSDVQVRLSREIADLESTIDRSLRERASDDMADVGLRPAETMNALGDSSALVSYFVLPDGVLASVTRAESVTWLRLPVALDAIGGEIERLHHQLNSMSTTAALGPVNLPFMRRATDRHLHALYAHLVAPLRSHLDGISTLFVVPFGVLHRVPFECLTDGASYFTDAVDVVRLPSSSTVTAAASRRPRRTASVALAAMITRGPHSAGAELSDAHARWPHATVLADPTSGDIRDLLPSTDLIHLCTHGTFRSDNPLFSRLATRDGSVFVADLLDARTEASLIVLSACESGTVRSGLGGDVSGVATTLLEAGARQVIATHWSVHDEATTVAMAALHDSLAGGGGLDPVAALRHARAACRERWDHPYYWGGFALYGG